MQNPAAAILARPVLELPCGRLVRTVAMVRIHFVAESDGPSSRREASLSGRGLSHRSRAARSRAHQHSSRIRDNRRERPQGALRPRAANGATAPRPPAQRRKARAASGSARQSLEPMCALPRFMTREEQAGQQMAQAFGRMFLGPGIVIPGPAPITQAHVDCLLNAYHARAAAFRSKLTGDALAEARLSPEQRADLQQALAAKGFLRSDQIGPGKHDGEFGPITRTAIKQFQQSIGAAPTGFLSADQRAALLERPEERAAREARIAAETARREAEEKARQDALIAKAAAEAKAKAEAEIAAAREAERIAAAERSSKTP